MDSERSANYFQTTEHPKGYIRGWWRFHVRPLGSLSREDTAHMPAILSHKMLLCLAQALDPIWFPGSQQNQASRESKWGSPLPLFPCSEKDAWSISPHPKLNQLLKSESLSVHQLLSGHHCPWLLDSNYLIISQTSRAPPFSELLHFLN